MVLRLPRWTCVCATRAKPGYRQHGGVTLRFVDPDADEELIEWAHLDAVELFAVCLHPDSVATRPCAMRCHALSTYLFKEVSGG